MVEINSKNISVNYLNNSNNISVDENAFVQALDNKASIKTSIKIPNEEIRDWKPSFFDKARRTHNSFIDTLGEMASAGADGFINVAKKTTKNIISYASDTDFIQKSNRNFALATNKTIQTIENYYNNPDQLSSDIKKGSDKIIADASNASEEFFDEYKDAKKYGQLPEFIGSAGAAVFPMAIGAAFKASPAGRAVSFFPNENGGKMPDYIPDGSPHYENRKLRSKDVFSSERNKELLNEFKKIDDMKGMPKFQGIVSNRKELFASIDGLKGKDGYVIIDPSVDRTGLINYLTRFGDENANNQEFLLARISYNNGFDEFGELNSLHSPTIIYTSGKSNEIDLDLFIELDERLDERFTITWHNHPSGDPAFSDDDLHALSTQDQKSSLISAVDTSGRNFNDEETGFIQTNRWSLSDIILTNSDDYSGKSSLFPPER